MKIKKFLIIIYALAGFFISIFTAFMTFIIINEPIGLKMFTKIVITVLLSLPLIMLISYYIGNYLSNKFKDIESVLLNIKDEKFETKEINEYIKEVEEIKNSINFLSKKLNQLIEDLKIKNRNLSTMLISLAHDVKTPLTILNGYIEELEDDLISKDNLKTTTTKMQNEVKFIDELSSDIVRFINSMQNRKIKNIINLNQLIMSEVLPLLKKDIEIENLTPINYQIEFNRVDLKKIAINLLSNAIKFSAKDSYIRVFVEDEKKIIFENRGIKINKKHKNEIFEPFFTLSKSRNRREGGLGLGLTISKNLALNNNYNLYFDDNYITATRFILIARV